MGLVSLALFFSPRGVTKILEKSVFDLNAQFLGLMNILPGSVIIF